MNFTVACPSCQRPLRVPEKLVGQAVKCPSCSHVFTVPENVEEEAPRRPAPPPPPDAYDEEPRPAKRRVRTDDYDEDYDDAPGRRSRRDEKPGKAQAIAIMVLIGGIIALLNGLIVLAYFGLIGVASFGFGLICCLWPGPYYAIVLGIMAILRGSRLLSDKAYRETPPQGIGIMMVINIINGDMINLTLGILVLIFLSDNEVKDYFGS